MKYLIIIFIDLCVKKNILEIKFILATERLVHSYDIKISEWLWIWMVSWCLNRLYKIVIKKSNNIFIILVIFSLIAYNIFHVFTKQNEKNITKTLFYFN